MKQLISHVIRVKMYNARGGLQSWDDYDISDREAASYIGRKISQWLAAEEGNKVVSMTVKITRISIS